MTTNAQATANKRNAQRSTGPRSTEGKRRASLNALRHGAYSTRTDSVTSTILDEYDDALAELTAAIIEELDPRGHLEMSQAITVAQLVVNQQRAHSLTPALLSGLELSKQQRHARIGPAQVEMSTAHGLLILAEAMLEDRSPDPGLVQSHCRLLHSRATKPFSLVARYKDGIREPATDREWQATLRRLFVAQFGSLEDAVAWAQARMDLFEEDATAERLQQTRLDASMLIEGLERLNALHERVDRSVVRAIKSYRALQELRLRPPPKTRNEPNPT